MALPSNDQHVTYQLQYRKCGKASCSTCSKGQGHGPYWYAYWREGTRLRSGYVGKVNPNIVNEQSEDSTNVLTTGTENSSPSAKAQTDISHTAIETLSATSIV